MSRIRVGIIGAGSWATSAHIPALQARPEVELVSLCRRDAEIAQSLKTRFGFAHATTDYRETLAEGLDAVIVSSPTAQHREQVLAAFASGAHVLCEKPMSILADDAWAMVSAAEAAQKQLLISFGWNFMPIFLRARELVQREGIGEIEHATIHMSSATRELLSNSGSYPDADPSTVPQQSTWTDPKISGGGYGQAQLSHALGVFFGLFPVPAIAATGLLSAPLAAPVELHMSAALRLENGAVVSLSGGSNHVGASGNKHELEIRVIGSEGQLIFDVHREMVWLYRADGRETRLDLAEEAGAYQASGPANALVDVALGRAEANTAPGNVGALTVEALELVYANTI